MFSAFSHSLASLASSQGYRLDYCLDASGVPSMGEITDDATYLAFQKIDIATLICLHVVDATKLDWQDIINRDTDHLSWAKNLLDKVQNVAIIYVLTGEGPPPWHGTQPEGFIDYVGQRAYSVFWWQDMTCGAVSVSRNQPSQLFGIRNLIEKARIGAANEDFVASLNETETGNQSPQKKYSVTTLAPVHRIPLFTFLFIGINAVILVMMYIAGYPVDMRIPLRFGAILPQHILEYGEWWRLFTAMFVHFGAGHFFANVLGLVIFGTRIERYFGRVAFVIIYIVSGLLGSLFSLYFTRGYAAGASGAIYGLIGAIFIYTRMTGRAVELMNWYSLVVFIGVGIAMGFMTPGVDNYGHLGGLAGGVIVGLGMVALLKLRGRE